jgi:thiol-disulfide isomerase/thioredoxin
MTPKQAPRQAPKQRTTAAKARSAGRGSTTTRRWFLAGIVAVLVVAAVVAIAASRGDDDVEAKPGEVGPRVTVEGTPLPTFAGVTPDPTLGSPTPVLTGESFDGHRVTTQGTGRPQVIVFLAHWCPHCRAEVPRLVELARDGAFDGVDVIAVATDTRPEAPNYPPSAWLEREDWPFPVLADDAELRAGRAFGLRNFPYFVFVDADGDVVGRASGEVDPQGLRTALDDLRASAGG